MHRLKNPLSYQLLAISSELSRNGTALAHFLMRSQGMEEPMNIIAAFMGRDHDRLDELYKGFRSEKTGNPAKAKDLFSEFKQGLQRHIIWEEEFLFPRFESRTGPSDGGPVPVMRWEHRRIKGLLDRIHDEVATGRTDTDD